MTVLVSTILWAYAFSRIYTRPITRLAASEWIYQNVPGPIGISIEENGSITNQPLAYPLGTEVDLENPVRMVITNKDSGNWSGVDFSHIVDPSSNSSEKTLLVTATDLSAETPVVGSGSIRNSFGGSDDPRGNGYQLLFDQAIPLEPGHDYSIEFRILEPGATLTLAGPTAIRFTGEGETASQALPEPSRLLHPGESYSLAFNPRVSGNLTGLTLGRIVDWESVKDTKKLELLIESSNPDGSFQPAGSGSLSADFLVKNNPRGEPATIVLDQPVKVEKGQPYRLTLTFTEGGGALGITGSRQINESSWDDPLPYPMDGYSPFDYNNGIYRTDLNLELYWDDNVEKLQRISNALEQGDYIFISSNRQWGSLTRIPERYPTGQRLLPQPDRLPGRKDDLPMLR